ncbi:hypothetical protein PCK1_001316 [Pneumocystis canis]|nr:hypothetical protein PCK1_001316 [Pneumocystis canis]
MDGVEIGAAEKDDFVLDSTSVLEFTNLGAGNEVGRSCHVIQFKGKTVMLDAGVHPAYNGLAAFPFYDEIDLSTVDILLISQLSVIPVLYMGADTCSFHIDHVASLPYVMTKTNFKGRVFMTHPTKAIYKWLLTDFLRVSNTTSEEQLYEEKDLIKSLEKIEVVDYHSTVEVNGVKFTPYHAGHVLGAAMFFIEVAGIKILFTGDYSREEDRHLIPAELPPIQPDILITESTYGTASHQPIAEKELRLTNIIHSIVRRGGRVLIPVFALGRTQELMLIIDEYWHNHPELHSIPYIILETKIYPELKSESLVREVINRVQRFRKKAGLLVTDDVQMEYFITHDPIGLDDAILQHQTLLIKILRRPLEKNPQVMNETDLRQIAREEHDVKGAVMMLRLLRFESSSSSDYEADENEWADFNEVEPAAQCLFCCATFDVTQQVYEHCKEDHAFDLPSLQCKFKFDFYNTVRLINYIRDQVRQGLSPDVMTPENYVGLDIYLRPVIEDDQQDILERCKDDENNHVSMEA